MKIYLPLLVLVLFFVGCEEPRSYAFKDENRTYSSKKLQELSERHLEFWEAFSKKDFNTTYRYELPYLQFIKSLKWYNTFNLANNKHYSIIQKDIKVKRDDFALIKTQYKLKENSYIFNDPWYLVDGIWYHEFSTSKLPE
jgi:hypothetical protein